MFGFSVSHGQWHKGLFITIYAVNELHLISDIWILDVSEIRSANVYLLCLPNTKVDSLDSKEKVETKQVVCEDGD